MQSAVWRAKMICLPLMQMFSPVFFTPLQQITEHWENEIKNSRSTWKVSEFCTNFNPSPLARSETVKKMIIKARQIYTLAKYHESCSFTQTQFFSTATPGKQPSLPLSRWRLGFWIMTSSKSCIWMPALQCLQKCWSSHKCWSHFKLIHTYCTYIIPSQASVYVGILEAV